MDVLVIAAAVLASTAQFAPITRTYAWTNATVTAGGATTGPYTVNPAPADLLVPAKFCVVRAFVVITGQAAGPTTLTVSVGRGAANDYVLAGSAKAAAATMYGDAENELGTGLAGGLWDCTPATAQTQVNVVFTSTGANLSTVTASTGRVTLVLLPVPADVYALAQDNLTITSPSEFGFYKRGAPITVAGTNNGSACTIEARIGGGDFATVASNVTGAFSGTITAPATCLNDAPVDIRCTTTTDPITVARVSVGIRLLGMGQSNMSGFATNNQPADYAGRRLSMYRNCYDRGNIVDPTDLPCLGDDAVARDTPGFTGAKGSPWPRVASLLAVATDCPIEFMNTAMGGTAISAWLPTANHQDRSTLYGQAIYRAILSGGVDLALWWQGEADQLLQRSRAAYNADLDTVADAVFADLGVKLMPCKLQDSLGIASADQAPINLAIGDAWADNVHVATGPDLTDIVTDDNYHPTSDAKMITIAGRWATTIQTALGM